MDSYVKLAARASSSPRINVLTARVVAAIVVFVVLTSCTPTAVQQNAPNTLSPEANKPKVSEINVALATLAKHTALSNTDYQIGPEDLLQIILFNVGPEETKVTPRAQTVRVSHRGLISLPLIGELRVVGLTASGLERELRKQYDRYIHNPQIGVTVTEYRQRVSVVGSVQTPGLFELTGPKTVMDILSMAGGVTEKAGTQVHIYREGPDGRESHVIDLLALASNASLINANNAGLITTPVQSGDVINVPPAGMFFVDGAVKAPGAYALGRRYSLTQALATAGGINPDLNSADITIFRRKGMGSGIEQLSIDLNDVLAGSTIDPQVEADDVIVVPINSLKYVYHRVFGQLLGWGTSIAGVAAVSGT
jgi:polysaccharide export outer membrane protein